jgi:hypothetical protein
VIFKDLSSTKKYKIIKELIEKERKERGMKKEDLKCGARSEPSCEHEGESKNFVEFQLMKQPEECEETWGMLRKSQKNLDLAYDMVYEYLVLGKRFGGK